MYPYDVVGAQRQIKQNDFNDSVSIVPVADPNIFSQTQRISLAQTEMQLAAANPGIHNTYEVYRNMYEALGVKDIDKILIRPQQPQVHNNNSLSGSSYFYENYARIRVGKFNLILII